MEHETEKTWIELAATTRNVVRWLLIGAADRDGANRKAAAEDDHARDDASLTGNEK